VLADLLLVESLASTLAGTLILALSSRTGLTLWLAVALLVLAFVTGCFLIVSVYLNKNSTKKRTQMILVAQSYKILPDLDTPENTD
jgi:ABC-type dipeptide/oligopeptide/nickel transport system permease component